MESAMSMTFIELYQLIFQKLPPLIRKHSGLAVFARERAKFEGWLKVELCNIFVKEKNGFKNTVPEKDWIDIVFRKWAIELKTINTNYRYDSAVNKTRPITDNVRGLIDAIISLRDNISIKNYNKAVVFIVFPLSLSKSKWNIQLNRIKNELRGKLVNHPITFKNGLPGIVYVGEVK